MIEICARQGRRDISLYEYLPIVSVIMNPHRSVEDLDCLLGCLIFFFKDGVLFVVKKRDVKYLLRDVPEP